MNDHTDQEAALAARFFDRLGWFNFFVHTMLPFRFSPQERARRDQVLLQYQWHLNTKEGQ